MSELSKEERLIKKLKDDGQIVLMPRYGKTQGPMTICPVADPMTGQMLGVKVLTDEEKKKVKRVVEPDTFRKIESGTTFKADNEIDVVDWEWIVYNKEIAEDRKTCNTDATYLYYVEDIAAEQKGKVSERELALEASMKIKELSEDRRVEVARLFGIPAKQMQPYEVKEFLYDKAEKFPQMVLERASDKQTTQKLFVMDLIDANIVKQDSLTQVFKYGEIKMGTSISSVIDWLAEEENREIARELHSRFKS